MAQLSEHIHEKTDESSSAPRMGGSRAGRMNPEGGKEKSIISPQTPAALLSKQGSPVSFSSTGRGNLAAHDVLLIERLSLTEMGGGRGCVGGVKRKKKPIQLSYTEITCGLMTWLTRFL